MTIKIQNLIISLDLAGMLIMLLNHLRRFKYMA